MTVLTLSYVLLAALTIFATIRASHYIDQLDKKTKISGALLGGVLLAGVTSLPEFITSLTSTMRLDNPGMALGNVFGSNIFNLLILAFVDLLFIKHFFFNNTRSGYASSKLIVFMYLIFFLPFFMARIGLLELDAFGITIGLSFSAISLIIVGVYILNIKKTQQEILPHPKSESAYSLKIILVRFSLYAATMVVASFFLTIVAEDLSVELGLSASFAGAILLGVATSLPEFTALITLVKLQSYDIAIGNILGSNLFNMLIISVVDILNADMDIFSAIATESALFKNVFLLLILGLINSIMVVVALKRKPVQNKWLYAMPSAIIISTYILYIVLSI